MNIFHCEGVVYAFGGVRALDGITLGFSVPGICAVIGPNGAGKTTLLNVWTGFLHANAGRCFLEGRETTHLAPHKIARLGVSRTFQDLRLVSQVSVLENVLLACPGQKGERLLPALIRFGTAKEEARNVQTALQWLQFVGLAEKANEVADSLSYGQQKLLALACSLATEARTLFFDEPVAGIHPEMISHIVALLRRLRDQGKLVVFIEHDIGVVREIADRVIVMDHGQIIADGIPKDVLVRQEILEAYVG